MIKSAFYIIFSIIFLSSSALIVRWIIVQETERVGAEQTKRTISDKNNHIKEDEPEDDAGDHKVTGYEKDEADRLLVDVDILIDSMNKSELAE